MGQCQRPWKESAVCLMVHQYDCVNDDPTWIPNNTSGTAAYLGPTLSNKGLCERLFLSAEGCYTK